MSDQGRRGMFRLNRSRNQQQDQTGDQFGDTFEVQRPLSDLALPDDEEVSTWETPPAATSRKVPRRTADMFAPKETISDTWSEDAWDDEWKEPAIRRTSIPPAADPTPDKVDQWLESDASEWHDVTRDSARKLGVDPSLAAARAVRPGQSWDDTGDVVAAVSSATTEVSSTTDASAGATTTADPDLQATIERALANSAVDSGPVVSETTLISPITTTETTDTTDTTDTTVTASVVSSGVVTGGVSRRFGRGKTTFAPAPLPPLNPEDKNSDQPEDATNDPARTEQSKSLDDTVEPERVVDIADKVGASVTETSTPESSTPESSTPESTVSLGDPAVTPITVKIVDSSVAGQAEDGASELSNKSIADGPSLDAEPLEEIEMDRARALAFVDRATWIGTGVAAIAGLRLALHVASGLKQSNPASGTLTGLTRLGSAFTNAGVLHGLLLIAAVTLLSLPALFNRGDLVPQRTGSGLGLVLGGSILGIVGAIVGLLTQSSMAKALDSTVSLGSRGELLAAIGLGLVALGATLRALRSYTE
jgi:hypothetical protein